MSDCQTGPRKQNKLNVQLMAYNFWLFFTNVVTGQVTRVLITSVQMEKNKANRQNVSYSNFD